MSNTFCVKNPSEAFIKKVTGMVSENQLSACDLSFDRTREFYLRVGRHTDGCVSGLLGWQATRYSAYSPIPERLEKNVRTRCIQRALGIKPTPAVKKAIAEPAFIWEPSPELLKKLGKGEEKIEAKSWLFSVTIGDGVGKSHYTYPLKIENGGDLSIQNIYDAICDTFKVKNSDRGDAQRVHVEKVF
jgi:hypothetical protein